MSISLSLHTSRLAHKCSETDGGAHVYPASRLCVDRLRGEHTAAKVRASRLMSHRVWDKLSSSAFHFGTCSSHSPHLKRIEAVKISNSHLAPGPTSHSDPHTSISIQTAALYGRAGFTHTPSFDRYQRFLEGLGAQT